MSLNLIFGPVFSGKTTELIRHGKRFSAIGWKSCCILPEQSVWTPSSHAQVSWDDTRWVKELSSLKDAMLKDTDIRVILLDDAHFWAMDDILRNTLETWLNHGKIIFAAGLDANSNGEAYRDFLQWLPLCDNVQKLSGLMRSAPYHFKDAEQSGDGTKLREETLQFRNTFQPLKELKQGTCATYVPQTTQGTGELHLILGPMFAGKTTELLRQATRHWHAGSSILFINHSWNERYGTVDICSHDGVRASPRHWGAQQNVQFVRGLTLEEAYYQVEMHNWMNIEAIFVEEGQFFSDLIPWVPKWIAEGKRVYICGLDGDAKQMPFGQLWELIPLAKSLVKERALCQQCGDGTEAPFTKKLTQTSSSSQVEVGTHDIYRAVCRKHFYS